MEGFSETASSTVQRSEILHHSATTPRHLLILLFITPGFNGAIVGQGGPTNAQFANLWTQIASKYKSNSKIVFGIMNEPVSLPGTQHR